MKKENKTQKWKSKTSSRKKKSHVLLLINFPRELLESCFRFQYHGWWFFSRLCCRLFSFIRPLISIYSSSSSFIPLHPFLFYMVFVLFFFCSVLSSSSRLRWFFSSSSLFRSFVHFYMVRERKHDQFEIEAGADTSTSIYNLLWYTHEWW